MVPRPELDTGAVGYLPCVPMPRWGPAYAVAGQDPPVTAAHRTHLPSGTPRERGPGAATAASSPLSPADRPGSPAWVRTGRPRPPVPGQAAQCAGGSGRRYPHRGAAATDPGPEPPGERDWCRRTHILDGAARQRLAQRPAAGCSAPGRQAERRRGRASSSALHLAGRPSRRDASAGNCPPATQATDVPPGAARPTAPEAAAGADRRRANAPGSRAEVARCARRQPAGDKRVVHHRGGVVHGPAPSGVSAAHERA